MCIYIYTYSFIYTYPQLWLVKSQGLMLIKFSSDQATSVVPAAVGVLSACLATFSAASHPGPEIWTDPTRSYVFRGLRTKKP